MSPLRLICDLDSERGWLGEPFAEMVLPAPTLLALAPPTNTPPTSSS